MIVLLNSAIASYFHTRNLTINIFMSCYNLMLRTVLKRTLRRIVITLPVPFNNAPGENVEPDEFREPTRRVSSGVSGRHIAS